MGSISINFEADVRARLLSARCSWEMPHRLAVGENANILAQNFCISEARPPTPNGLVKWVANHDGGSHGDDRYPCARLSATKSAKERPRGAMKRGFPVTES